jgi:hypothetical protein
MPVKTLTSALPESLMPPIVAHSGAPSAVRAAGQNSPAPTPDRRPDRGVCSRCSPAGYGPLPSWHAACPVDARNRGCAGAQDRLELFVTFGACPTELFSDTPPETHQDQLPNRARCTKCLDLVSLAPLPSMPYFHPLPCPIRTSRFLIRQKEVN